jgi:two-component system, chemotaxis family, sensor kinase CheA
MGLDLAQFHESFFEESFEAIDAMEAALLKLEVGVADHERINTIFRGAHSMKGGAGMLGFDDVASFTHTLETLLDELRSGRKQVTAAILDSLLKSVDVAREMLRAVKSKQPVDAQRVADMQFDLETLVAQKDASTSPAQPAAGAQAPTAAQTTTVGTDSPGAALAGAATSLANTASPPGSQSAPGDVATANGSSPGSQAPGGVATANGSSPGWTIGFEPLPHLLLQGNDPLAIFAALKDLGPVDANVDLSRLPLTKELDPQLCYLAWQLRLHTDCAREQIEEAFDWTTGDCELTIEHGLKSPAVTTDATPAILTTSGSTAVATATADVKGITNHAASETQSAERATSASPGAGGPDSAKSSGPSKHGGGESSSIRVGIDKIDELINTVGELVITQAMLTELGREFEGDDADLLRSGLGQLERNMRELQETVMRVRMLPINVAFSRFPRMVHDLAQRLGKKIELKVSGEQTELDKTVLEKIGDPLVHLVRNSIDHGIETPDIRTAAGKTPFGTITLSAYHSGGNIAVEITDDGAGLNKERILTKARDRGLVDPNDTLTDEQIHDLIFLPGFSTAEKTTDVSGRGVGMDVVRQRVAELGGSVDIRSEAGQGSRFLITLPLTLSIVDGQSVLVGTETYIIPLTCIVESLQLQAQKISRLSGTGEVFPFRGEYLPILRLHSLFNIEPRSRVLQEGLIVVVEGDGRRMGLFIDEMLGQQQVVIKSLESNYGRIEGISGATILGDGLVALILDVPGLIRAANLQAAA